ncbi:NifB/NifX family molybdenum-iron cluster-binding protein [Chloroflexota bacterium]
MKIAVTAEGPTLDSKVDSRFGRCQYFIVADPETLEFEAIENSSAMGGGAGISASQIIAGKQVDVVLTGNCGPNAYRALSAAGIKVVTEVSGDVREAIQGYKLGKLKVSAQPNVAAHFGIGTSRRYEWRS